MQHTRPHTSKNAQIICCKIWGITLWMPPEVSCSSKREVVLNITHQRVERLWTEWCTFYFKIAAETSNPSPRRQRFAPGTMDLCDDDHDLVDAFPDSLPVAWRTSLQPSRAFPCQFLVDLVTKLSIWDGADARLAAYGDLELLIALT